MAFVKWVGSLEGPKSSSFSTVYPSVNISTKLGQVSFSPLAVQLMKIDKNSLIDIYVDKDNKKIGFEVVKEKGGSTAAVFTKKAPKTETLIYKIAIKAIINELITKKTKAFGCKLEVNESDGLFFIDLNEN